MRAEITDAGMLEITPISKTEETMLGIWLVKDKTNGNKKVKEALIAIPFEEIGPACIKSIAETAGSVNELTSEMKKELRKNIKAELDAMVADEDNPLESYNNRAATPILKGFLEKAKAAAVVAGDPSQKKPTETIAPKKEPAEPVAPPAKEPDVPPTESAGPPPTIDDVREAVKLYAATAGNTKAKEMLVKYKATNISTLKEADYAAIIKDMEPTDG